MTSPNAQIKQVSCPTKESVLLFFQHLSGFVIFIRIIFLTQDAQYVTLEIYDCSFH